MPQAYRYLTGSAAWATVSAFILGTLFTLVVVYSEPTAAFALESAHEKTADPRDDLSPWGVASGSEWLSAYPAFNPLLRQAGVRWLRAFYEWQEVEPQQGRWNFSSSDSLVNNARINGIHLAGVFGYFAPWASDDGGTRKFPIKNIQFWRDYVSGMVGRYHSDIKYWEVWNEFNGSFSVGGTAAMYAELVREASITAKAVDPTAKIGMSVANFDVNFLDAAIKAGAAGYFDYICVHPYEMLGGLTRNGEPEFLAMATTLRRMLELNHQPRNMPLWITEMGSPAPIKRDDAEDQAQASLLAKGYLLSIAAGFQRIFWFEARGPSYGKDRDLGLIRSDFTPRPAYSALSVLSHVLGSQPTATGWLDLGAESYGFVFDTGSRSVLAAWSHTSQTVKFDADVQVSNLAGQQTTVLSGVALGLSNEPVLITGLPSQVVEKARTQQGKPYPWTNDYSEKSSVTILLGAKNIERGIKQINPATTIPDEQWLKADFSRPDKEGHYVYFGINPQFAIYGSKAFEITAVVKRVAPDKVAGMSIDYESDHGYVGSDYRNIPQSDGWQEISWALKDVNFVGAWGWNFRLNGIASPNEFLVKEVIVRRRQ
jgi:polysaccharide biosynthesis protein PslG